MVEIELTREADELVTVLYRIYLHRRECGSPRRSASYFGTAEQIKERLPRLWHLYDVEDACWELVNAGLLDALPGDDTVNEAKLSDLGIIWNQQRFKRGLSDVLSTLETAFGIAQHWMPGSGK